MLFPGLPWMRIKIEARALELIQLAIARGFRDELDGSVQAYVMHLMSQAAPSRKSTRTRKQKQSARYR
jgi:hypothetical protein